MGKARHSSGYAQRQSREEKDYISGMESLLAGAEERDAAVVRTRMVTAR